MINIDIIYEDDDILVCYKPAGVATQTKRLGQPDMESLLKNYRAKKKEPPYIGIVHRLDQPVEGVMVFAKNREAAASLSSQVRKRSIGKHYYAVAVQRHGCALKAQGELTDYIASDERSNLSKIVPKGTKDAKQARLSYRIIGEAGERICVDVLLHTGRHHQIRVQLAHANAPLVGDVKYGGAGEDGDRLGADCAACGDGAARKTEEQEPLALCSCRLTFAHPGTKKTMDFSVVPKGTPFADFLDNMGVLA